MTKSKKQTVYSRKLSAIERYNLVINEVIRYDVEAIIEGEGKLDIDKWQRAVAIAADANPGSRIRLKSVLGFCKWVDSGTPPEVVEVKAPAWDGYSEQGISQLQKRFTPLQGGPICDVKLIQGSPARAVIRACHGAMDARGIEHFIYDIFRALRDQQPVGSKDTLTDLDIRLKNQDKVTAEPMPKVSAIPAMPVSEQKGSELKYLWRRVTIGNKVTNILPKMAIFLAKQARLHDTGATVFTIPVDFRGLREEIKSTANLTGYLKIPVTKKDSARDVMRHINQQIRQHADCINPGYVKMLPWIPIRLLKHSLAKNVNTMLYTTNEELPTAGIVSLGHFKLSDWSYSGFTASAAIGIPGFVGKLNVVMHNYSDRTEIIFSTPAAYNESGQLDQLIDAVSNEFEKGQAKQPESDQPVAVTQ